MMKKILIIGISMDCGGTEQALLSMLRHMDLRRCDVTLLLAQRGGRWLNRIPPEIRVISMEDPGAKLFRLSSGHALRCAFEGSLLPHPLRAFRLLPPLQRYLAAYRKDVRTRTAAATRLWIAMMAQMKPLPGVWDTAIAFWGDRTMFYLCDKVTAKCKIAWLHFDYGHPPREDALYADYFARCDRVITVSPVLCRKLRRRMPELADRFRAVENFFDPAQIRALAAQPDAPFYPDDGGEPRVLTVGRLCPQKGIDRIPYILARLRQNGIRLRWYVIGEGERAFRAKLLRSARQLGVTDSLIFLGAQDNPYRMMAHCDLYVQPSRFEGKPITVEEAKALGCTILTSAYTSAREQLRSVPGAVVCTGGNAAIAEEIRRFFEKNSKSSPHAEAKPEPENLAAPHSPPMHGSIANVPRTSAGAFRKSLPR